MSGRERSSPVKGTVCVNVLRLRRACHCQGTERIASFASVAGAEWAERKVGRREAWRKKSGTYHAEYYRSSNSIVSAMKSHWGGFKQITGSWIDGKG